MRGEPIRGHAREGRPGTRPPPDICVGHAEGRRRTPSSLSLRSHNQSPPLSRRLTTRFRTDRTRLFMCSCISASGTVNQRQIGARGLSMRGETIRRDLGEGRPDTRPHQPHGPPRETSTHATPCRKAPYARRKRERPGRVAGALTLNRSARQCRVWPILFTRRLAAEGVSGGLRPLM